MDENRLTEWLLQSQSPSIRYRVQRDLFDSEPDPQLREEIEASKPVRRIFAKMHPDGYWLHRGVGSGIDYAMSSSTHFVLSFLAELGLDRSHPVVDMAVNRYLDMSEPDTYLAPPDHLTQQSCLFAHNLRTFILLGYKNDGRFKARVKALVDDVRREVVISASVRILLRARKAASGVRSRCSWLMQKCRSCGGMKAVSAPSITS